MNDTQSFGTIFDGLTLMENEYLYQTLRRAGRACEKVSSLYWDVYMETFTSERARNGHDLYTTMAGEMSDVRCDVSESYYRQCDEINARAIANVKARSDS